MRSLSSSAASSVLTSSPSPQATDSLDREAASDDAHRQGHGSLRWTRPSSSSAAAPLRERAQQLGAVLSSAAESDAVVRAKFGEWERALRVLERGQPALAREIPASGASPAAEVPEAQRAARRALSALLDQLSDLRSVRARVVEAARTSVAQGDIRDKVLREAERRAASAAGAGGGAGSPQGEGAGLAAYEELLEREGEALMRVWDEEMRRSDARQEDLLGEIKVRLLPPLPESSSSTAQELTRSHLQQAQHSALRSASAAPSSAQQARERATTLYASAGDKFTEMLQNLQEGLRFYADLSKLLGELRDACKSVRPSLSLSLSLSHSLSLLHAHQLTPFPAQFDYARTAEAQDLTRALSAPPAPQPSPAPSPAPAPAPAPTPPAEHSTPRRRAARAAAAPAADAATPRRSTRRTAHAAAAVEPEPAPAPAPAPRAPRQPPAGDDSDDEVAQTLVARPAKTPQRRKKAAPAVEVEEERVEHEEEEVERAAEPAAGAWDPTQGIRFG